MCTSSRQRPSRDKARGGGGAIRGPDIASSSQRDGEKKLSLPRRLCTRLHHNTRIYVYLNDTCRRCIVLNSVPGRDDRGKIVVDSLEVLLSKRIRSAAVIDCVLTRVPFNLLRRHF